MSEFGGGIDQVKPFWASQTIWSALAVIGASITGAVLAWRAGDLTTFGTSMTAAIGGAVAIAGRVRATKPIG